MSTEKQEKQTVIFPDSPIMVLLDAGHGKDTPGKRSPKWDDGSQLFEWKFNRELQGRIIGFLGESQISYSIISPEINDIGNTPRAERANAIAKENKYTPCLYISLHGNAAGVESASGFEVFTSPGQTKSDLCASEFFRKFGESGLFEKMRSDTTDGDEDKETEFTVLMKTNMAAVLLELGFYTNYEECQKMLSDEFQNDIAMVIVDTVNKIIRKKILV